MTDPTDFLQAYSELAIAIIGFSGIVIALKARNHDRVAFRGIALSMLTGLGSISLVCAIAPQIMLEYGMLAEEVWRTTSALIVAGGIAGALRRTREAAELEATFDQITGRPVRMILAMSLLIAAANIYFGLFWVFMLNLLFYLIVCTNIFYRLLLESEEVS